jgi:hypothetical protein
MGYSQFSVVGGVLLVVAACMILGLMRESIPYAVRRGAQVTLFVAVLAGGLWYASLNGGGVRWPSWQWTTPVVAAQPAKPTVLPVATSPRPKTKMAPSYSSGSGGRQLRTGTLREVSPEEAAQLMKAVRALQAKQQTPP